MAGQGECLGSVDHRKEITVTQNPLTTPGSSIAIKVDSVTGSKISFSREIDLPPAPAPAPTTDTSTTVATTTTVATGAAVAGAVAASCDTTTPPPVTPTPPPAPAFTSVVHPMSVPSTLQIRDQAKPTNEWWENFILGKNRVGTEPYQVKLVDNGYLVCYPSVSYVNDGMEHLTTQWLMNGSLEFAENMGSWAVTAYDDLSVTVTWTASNGNRATSCIAQGSPFLSMTYTNLTPLFTTQHAIMSVNGATTPGPVSGDSFKITMNNGQTWRLYCSGHSNFTWTKEQLQATGPGSGTVRLAILVDQGDEAILDQYKTAVPTGGKVAVSFANNVATYSFNWDVAGSGPLLMLALPHHMDIIKDASVVGLTRQSVKGKMQAIAGPVWTLVEPLPTIKWTASKPIPSDKIEALAQQLGRDQGYTYSGTAVTYEGGKEMGKLAMLALIADELNVPTTTAAIRNNLRAAISPWLAGSSADQLVYDSTWGGIVSKEALADFGAQYGSGKYNDLVYHWGYFVFAAAVIARRDPSFVLTYKERVDELLKTYCNIDPGDTRFPLHRYKDLYAGHSLASGLFDFADNRNEESTSEAINGYAAMMLWGLVTNDQAVQNYGALMLAMEIRSAQKYWHVYEGNNMYGSQWKSNGVGIMWPGCKIDDSTWFDEHLSCRRCIQVIPLTQFSLLYLEPAWINAMKASGELDKMLAENFTIWPTFVNGLLAVIDEDTAWANVQAMTDAQIDPGCSRTVLMYWVATH